MPSKDADLVTWLRNFSTRLSEDPEAVHQTPASAASFAVLANNFFQAYTTSEEPSTRTSGTINARNVARDAVKNAARYLIMQINGHEDVTDQQKIDLGIHVRSKPQPIPAPAFSPVLEILSVIGHRVLVQIHGPDLTKRGLPDGVDGISLFSYVGDVCPTDPAKFAFEANTNQMKVEIVFDESVEPGTTVWITGMFFNQKKESSVAANPVSTKINFGGMQQVG
jgi:hypothetical protein